MPQLELVPRSGALPDDEEIKAIACENPRAAAEWIIRKYRDPLFHHAAWILKDWQEAIDVTQEVFIRAMREPRFFDEGFKMKAWLFRVTSNLCFNLVRDRKRRAGLLEKNLKPRITQANQVEMVVADERQQQIMEAIALLTPSHQEILKLRYYSDLSYAEIADTLQIKLGTVMSRLSRARGKLMEVLDDPRVVEG